MATKPYIKLDCDWYETYLVHSCICLKCTVDGTDEYIVHAGNDLLE